MHRPHLPTVSWLELLQDLVMVVLAYSVQRAAVRLGHTVGDLVRRGDSCRLRIVGVVGLP